MAKNINGPLTELGHLVRQRAERVLATAEGELGRKRAAYTVLVVEKMYSAYHPHDDSGYLSRDLADKIRALLHGHQSPYGAAVGESADELRAESRAIIMLLNNERQEKCVKAALDIHVAFDLYMRHHMGQQAYRGAFSAEDVHLNYNLRQAFLRVMSEVPELALNSQLGVSLSVLAA